MFRLPIHPFTDPFSLQGPPLRTTIKEGARLAWHGFKLVAKRTEEFVDGTPFKIPLSVLNNLIDIADVSQIFRPLSTCSLVLQAVIDNKESMAELLLPIGQRLEIVSKELAQKRLPEDMGRCCNRFVRCVLLPGRVCRPSLHAHSTLQWVTADLQRMHKSGILRRILEVDEHPKEIDQLFQQVDEATKSFEVWFHFHNGTYFSQLAARVQSG